jgi:hypothetical protein
VRLGSLQSNIVGQLGLADPAEQMRGAGALACTRCGGINEVDGVDAITSAPFGRGIVIEDRERGSWYPPSPRHRRGDGSLAGR